MSSLCSVMIGLRLWLWIVMIGLRRPSPLTLRREPRGHFHSECCTGGWPMAVPHMKLSLALIHYKTRGWTGRKYRFSCLLCDPTGIQTQPASICGMLAIP